VRVVVPEAVMSKWFTAKAADEPPAGTLTLGNTVASFVLELCRLTTAPFGPVGPLKVTVPITVAAEPPTTDESVRLMD
jgi:hypothetical protein